MTRQSSKPIVGINAEYKPAANNVPALSFSFSSYADSVIEAGGIPVILSPLSGPEMIAELLPKIDALVMVGGGDLDPRNDGYMLHPSVRRMDSRREKFDRALIAEAARLRLPVLGIGVGMQLLNVSQGGTLFLHIPEDIPGALPHRDTDQNHRHALIVEKGSLLDVVYGENDVRVTSMHHMAVDDVAPNFVVSARCPVDNVVEAIESTREDWFALGLQFHPESQSATVLDRRVFHEFVKGVLAFRETGINPFAWKPVQSKNGGSKTKTTCRPLFDVSETHFI